MNSVLLFSLACCAVAAVSAQMMPPSTMGGGGMPMPLPPNQRSQLMRQFFSYRLIFGDAAARIIMADRFANMMGGTPFSRYYAGEFFDTPDSWWITSSLMNRQQSGSGMTGI